MAFQGDLASFSLADVFQNLTQNKQSGTLQINLGVANRERHLYFQKGNLLYLSFGPGSRVIHPEIFRSKGLLDPEQYDKALNHSRDTGKPFIEAVLGLGLANPDQLAVAVTHAIEESVYDLFTWESGPFEFVEGQADSGLYDDQMALPLKGTPGASLIMEAARRIDEWERLKAQVKSLQNIYIFESDMRAAAETGEFGMAPHELAIMRVMDGSRDVDDLVEATRLSHFVVVNALVGFLNTSMGRLATVDELKNTILRLSVPGLENRKIKVYERILLLGGEDLSVRQALAETCISAGNAERAIAHLQVLAQSAEQANDKSEALRLYERILELEPDHINAHRRCGELLAAGGDSRRAAMHFAALYVKFEADGRFTEAAEACSKAVNSEPLNLQHRLAWVRCAMLADQRSDAMRELEYVGDQMSKQGRIRAAADIYKRLMVMEKSRPAIKAKLQNVLVSEDEKRARRRARTRVMFMFGVVVAILAAVAWWEFVHNRNVVRDYVTADKAAYMESSKNIDRDREDLNRIIQNGGLADSYKAFKTAEAKLIDANAAASKNADALDDKEQTIISVVPDSLWPNHPKKELEKDARDWRALVSDTQGQLDTLLHKYSDQLVAGTLEQADRYMGQALTSQRFSQDELKAAHEKYDAVLQIRDKTHDDDHGYAVPVYYMTYAERRRQAIERRLQVIKAYLDKEQAWDAVDPTTLGTTELADMYRQRSAMVMAFPLEDVVKNKPMPVVFIPENGQTGVTIWDVTDNRWVGVIGSSGLVATYSMTKPIVFRAQKPGYLPQEFSTRQIDLGSGENRTSIWLFGSDEVKFDLTQQKKRVIQTGVVPVAGAINPGNTNLIVIPDTTGNVVGVEVPAGRGATVTPKFKVAVANQANNEVILDLESLGGGSIYALVASANTSPRVIAVDTAKSEILWQTSALGTGRVLPQIGLYSPAALQGHTVVVVGTDTAFFILNSDGTYWQDKTQGIAPPNGVKWTTLPIINGTYIYLGADDGGVYRFDLNAPTDPLRFEISAAGEPLDSLTVRSGNAAQLVAVVQGAGGDKAVLFDTAQNTDTKSGKILQVTKFEGASPSTPLVQRNDFLFFGLNNGNLGMYQINTINANFSVVQLGNPNANRLTGPILVDGDFLYAAIDGGAPKCFALDGQQLDQKDVGSTEGKTPIGSPLLDVINDKVYFLIRETGEMYEMNRQK